MKRPVGKLLNDYHRLDYARVWNTLRDDIPRLRAAIERYRR